MWYDSDIYRYGGVFVNLAATLSDAYARNVLIVTGAFALFALLLIPAYFLSLRPVKGTTEWMSRIDLPEFQPLGNNKLRRSDLPFALLAGICAAVLRMASFLCIYLHNGIFIVVHEILSSLAMRYLLPSAILAIAIYLLLRSMFDATLPAVCVAILGGLVQIGNAWAAALTALSLLFLWLWTSLDADAGLFLRAVLFVIASACYGLALLRYWELVWLSPLFLGAFIYAQVYRWKKATHPGRGIRLALSLLLLFFAVFASFLASWAYYCIGKMDDPALMLNIRKSLDVVWQELSSRLHRIRLNPDPLSAVLARDAILFLPGAVSLIPVLHGILRWRDSLCFVLIALIPFFAAMWLVGGMYLFTPMLAILFGWVLSVIAKRGHAWLVIIFCAVPVAVFLFEHFI